MRRARTSFGAVVFESFLNRLAFGIVTFALPLYALELGLGITEIGLLVAAKAVVQPAIKPVMGIVIDRFGARAGYVLASSLRLASAVALFLAASPLALFLVRFLQGAASAANDPAAVVVVGERDDGRTGRRFSGVYGARDLGKVSAGLVGGGVLALTGSFSLLWALVVGLAALSVATVWFGIRDVALKEKPEPEPVAPADVEAATRILRSPRLRLIAALGLLSGLTAHMTHALFQVYAAEVAGLSAGQIGAIYASSVAVLLVVGPAAGWAGDRFGAGPLASARAVANAGSSLLYLVFPAFAGMLGGRLVDDAGKAAFRPTWGTLLATAGRGAGGRRGRVVSNLDAALAVGEALGPVVAALIWDVAGAAAFLLTRAALGVAVELLLGRRLRAELRRPAPPAAAPGRRRIELELPPDDAVVAGWLRRHAPDAPTEELARVWAVTGLRERLGPLHDGVDRRVAGLAPETRARLAAAAAALADTDEVVLAPGLARDAGLREALDAALAGGHAVVRVPADAPAAEPRELAEALR
ncbi:MAG TPA: MFS transporter [Gaiellaceae bacterium]|nr:MFS transporter [Gaiellaceae bacterium]